MIVSIGSLCSEQTWHVRNKLLRSGCPRCSNYIFILHLTPGFNRLGKDVWKTRQETIKFWDYVSYIRGLTVMYASLMKIIGELLHSWSFSQWVIHYSLFPMCLTAKLFVAISLLFSVSMPTTMEYSVANDVLYLHCTEPNQVLFCWPSTIA